MKLGVPNVGGRWGEIDAPRLRDLFEQAPGFMALVRGSDHRYEAVNRAYRAYMGERDFIGRTLFEVAPDLAAEGIVDLCDEVYRTGKHFVGRDIAIMVERRPGEPAVATRVDFVLHPVRADDGVVTGLFCQGHDVTGWRAAESELRASREELAAALAATQTIFDHSPDVICTLDAEGIYTRVSRRCEKMWGYRPDEMVGRHFKEFVHPEDVETSFDAMARIRGGAPTDSFMNRIVQKDGSAVPVMWSSVWSEAHQLEFAIARDMREHFRAEEKLRQAQKMEAVGRLTGGVAHDFNNLLTTVIGGAEALSEGLRDQPQLRELADLVLEAAERGADLVSRLLAFSRRQPLAPAVVESGALVESLAVMLRRTLREDIELILETQGEGLNCFADPAQLTSAMLNLCLNSRDAMPDGGVLTLRTELERDADGRAWVVLSVRDTGQGMPPEVAEHALEPFFTTKPAGQGSGLGLSMTHGFVSQSGGRMTIESEPGVGTLVRLYLPHTAEPPVRREPAPAALPTAEPRLILVVEDDDLVRDQVRRQLAALGYRVATSANAREAIERLSRASDVDLLLTDIVMPGGMNGRQLADQARLLKPDIKVLFTSGYTEDAILQRGVFADAFLAKPYRRAQLAQKVAEVLADG